MNIEIISILKFVKYHPRSQGFSPGEGAEFVLATTFG